MNCRMMNLLSSARLYVDQVPQDLHAIYGNSSKHAATFKECCSKQYDSSFAYRVLEALGNYAQHRGLSVHAMNLSFEREDTNFGSKLRAGLHLYVKIQRLEGSEFKKKVLNELKPRADRYGFIELTPFMPKYIGKLDTGGEFPGTDANRHRRSGMIECFDGRHRGVV